MAKRQQRIESNPKLGRPKADPVDRLKTKVWYLAVKARGGWSDYRLDLEFARNVSDPPLPGPSRIRAFEEIRRNGTVPSPGTHRRRGFNLVKRVESHPSFKGTAAYFSSPFWDLLKFRQMGVPEAHAFSNRLMKSCNIYRPSGKANDLMRYWFTFASGTSKPIPSSLDYYEAALNQLIATRPLDLEILALVGGLFREAYLVTALDIATVLSRQFMTLLELFCSQDWLDQETANALIDLGDRRVLHWQMGAHFLGEELYDDLPSAVVERPLFPLGEAIQQLIDNEDVLWRQFAAAAVAALGDQ